jgi:hypothetical protein
MVRYRFNIRTRSGQRVDNIQIMAVSESEAERRLRQMYHHCEVIDCHVKSAQAQVEPLDLEGVIAIISNEPSIPPSLLGSLRDKAGAH